MDARTFQEAIRSATVTYPIPFVFAVLLLFAILCLGGSLVSSGWHSVFLSALGGFCAMAAIGLVACAFVFKPELLRSEQHVSRMTMAGIIGDRDMPPDARERVSRAVLAAEGPLRPKSSDRDAERPDTHGGGTHA